MAESCQNGCRLERYVDRRAAHIVTIASRVQNGFDFGVIRARRLREAFAQHSAVAHDDATDTRIRRCVKCRTLRKRQRAQHEFAVGLGIHSCKVYAAAKPLRLHSAWSLRGLLFAAARLGSLLLDRETLAYRRCALRQRQRQYAVFEAGVGTFFGDFGRQFEAACIAGRIALAVKDLVPVRAVLGLG